MVFVDAQRYLKVQEDELDDVFNHHSKHGDDDEDDRKEASFESFQLDPTSFSDPHRKSWRDLFAFKRRNDIYSSTTTTTPTKGWKGYILPIAILSLFCIAVLVGLALLVILDSDTDDYEDGQDGENEGEDDEGTRIVKRGIKLLLRETIKKGVFAQT